jgi:glycosyltransferase involved in cell wall biosynthesis
MREGAEGDPSRHVTGTVAHKRSVARDPWRIVLVEFLPSGGMFQFSFQFAKALAEAGHHVQLLTGPSPELRSTTPNLEVFPTWHPNRQQEEGPVKRKIRRILRALLLVESWRRAVVHVRRKRPDIAQFGELRYPLDAAALLLTARLGHVGALVDVAHNPLPYDVTNKAQSVEKAGRFTRHLLVRAYGVCDLVLVLGEGPRAELLKHFPRVSHTAVCGHGNYDSVLTGTRTGRPSSAPPSALFFGAWTRYKNIPLMLDAFELLRSKLPQARLTLAGPVMPDVDLGAITARAHAIGNIDLLPGYVHLSRLPDLFARHRVVIFTYKTVNISGSVHMAYTFGRPVVATDVGAMRDAVEHGVTGLLAAPEPVAVAEAISRILRDPEAADRMGRAAARRAEHESSWSSVAEKAAAAYGEALARPWKGSVHRSRREWHPRNCRQNAPH